MALDNRRMQYSYPSSITSVGIQFTNPFPQSSAASSAQMMPNTLAPDGGFLRQDRASSLSHSYTSMNNASVNQDRQMAPPYFGTEMFTQNNGYNGDHSMPESSAPSPTASSFPVPTLGPPIFDFTSNPMNRLSYLSDGRRMSSPSVPSSTFLGSPVEVNRQRQNSMIDFRGINTAAPSTYSNLRHENFSDAIDSARGMLAMSQSGARNARNRQDSYYQSTHSTNSSISSAGSYHPYYGSVDSSATDISSGDTPTESVSRTLPRPSGYISSNTPANGAQSMMSTFSSKITSSTQKKHRCKICDKRFTRPSSLLTHTYSHTGEKPFSCEVEGCGRKFSVVSNLRRHKKVHRNQNSN
jgi:hypothetical protein